jgi:predicted Fe-Mo cluster-binding NifX family protein
MLACIPTNGNAGLDDTVNEHFGSTPYFTLYDTETDELKVVENRNSHHSHGTCHPINQLMKYRIDCIVCAGMGRRAIEALSTEGIKVYRSDTPGVRTLIDKIKAEELNEIYPAKACRGHGQRAGLTTDVAGAEQGRGAGHGRGGCHRHGAGTGGGRGQGGD